MTKLSIIIFPLLMLANTVTIKGIFDESESDKFLSSYHRPERSWNADSFHNSNYSTQTPNYELAREMKESNLGCLHFRIDLASAENFAAPGQYWERYVCNEYVDEPAELYDLKGRMVGRGCEINIDNCPNGLYIIKTENSSKKILITR